MHRQLWIGLLVGAIAYATSCVSVPAEPSPVNAQKTARIELVQEFVRELEVIYRLQQTGTKELAEDSSASGQLMTVIRNGSRTFFEMNESINRLNMISVDGRWAKFRDTLKRLHQHRMAVMKEMSEGAKALLSGPKPGVDYGKLMERAPELEPVMEEINKLMFTIAKAMFFALVDDDRVETDGNLHHLILTKKDRTNMVKLIDKIFGATLEDKNANYIVSSAWLIKTGLTQPHYKAADEI